MAGIQPVTLRTEYLENPLGIGEMHPRLSWALASTEKGERGQSQNAYRILVAASETDLRDETSLLWDSGKIVSDRTAHIRYAGKPVQSAARYWWKVKVWDEKGNESSSSEPAWWEMGLLAPEDWSAGGKAAQWLSIDHEERKNIPEGQWLWHPEGRKEGHSYYWGSFQIDAEKPVAAVTIRACIEDDGEVYINGKRLAPYRGWRRRKDYDITGLIRAGDNAVAMEAVHPFGANGVSGAWFGALVEYQDGSSGRFISDNSWRVVSEPPEGWTEADFKPDDNWAAPLTGTEHLGNRPWGKMHLPATFPSPLLRKSFESAKSVKKARAYISGLGYYELFLNGSKVGDHVLDPGQTNYEHFAFYVTYDVTDRIQHGKNALGINIGDGWYNQCVVWGHMSYGKPGAICKIQIDYEDGTNQTIVTDDSWRVAAGPIISNNIHDGEVYDARREIPGWSGPEFNDSAWQPAKVVKPLTPKLVPQTLPAIKKTETLQPIDKINPAPGVWVYDMGQNFAGWAKLKIEADAGTAIRLRFTETLLPDGNIDWASTGVTHTGDVQTDVYICKGGGVETWEPRFTYHGFRFVEVTGYPGEPPMDLLEGVAVHTSLAEAGRFECSNDLINRIHKMVLWTTRSNVHSVMTDCPARERCGWLGDAHVAAEMSIYNYDMAQFWTKFMFDIETSLGMGYATYTGRKATPGIPCNIAPGKRQCQEARPDWGSAIVLLPYYMYLYYGDADMLEHHYPHMKRWIEYAGKYAEDNIVVEGYGDWAPPGGNVAIRCPVPLTSTAYYYWTIELLADMAEQLGKTDDAAQLRDQAAVVKSAFIAKFLDKEARSYGSQTANIMALRLGLIPDGMEDDIAESLVQEIEVKHKGHHTTGIHGTRHLYWALSEYGYDDTAFGILTNTGFPSYSDLFERGATTMWEVMAKQSKTGRQPGVSHNHPMHCGFDAWFYSGILGIAPSPMAPGFKHIDMKPSLQNELQWAKGSYTTLRGPIKSHWRNVDGSFVWDIGIPPNTTATVRIPAKSIESVRESGLPASQAPGVKYLQMEDGMAVFAIGSGNYQFTAARRTQLNVVPGTTEKR